MIGSNNTSYIRRPISPSTHIEPSSINLYVSCGSGIHAAPQNGSGIHAAPQTCLTIFILKDGSTSYVDIKGVLNRNSFDNSIPYNEIREVIIGSTVTSIGVRAFESCTSLISITINDSVQFIDEYAFAYCSELQSLVIPDSVKSIGDESFIGCTVLSTTYKFDDFWVCCICNEKYSLDLFRCSTCINVEEFEGLEFEGLEFEGLQNEDEYTLDEIYNNICNNKIIRCTNRDILEMASEIIEHSETNNYPMIVEKITDILIKKISTHINITKKIEKDTLQLIDKYNCNVITDDKNGERQIGYRVRLERSYQLFGIENHIITTHLYDIAHYLKIEYNCELIQMNICFRRLQEINANIIKLELLWCTSSPVFMEIQQCLDKIKCLLPYASPARKLDLERKIVSEYKLEKVIFVLLERERIEQKEVLVDMLRIERNMKKYNYNYHSDITSICSNRLNTPWYPGNNCYQEYPIDNMSIQAN